jgi:RNA polymerase sigma factor (sigma-70 family)
MHTSGLRRALDHLRLADGGLADGQLLARFIDGRDEAAFAALVRRHGPMVLGVCRRVLGHAEDAEDAFQAAFLVLAKKAASVLKREAVASFLYGVAYRTALGARARAARRRATERQVEQMPHPAVAPPEAQDWRPLLDRELSRLPEKYRAAVVLCDLEGKTRREAARQLKLPEGTLSTRLAAARRMLARRLTRAGLTLSGGALAAALAEGAPAAVPAPWVSATARAAALVAGGQAAAVLTPAAALMNEVLGAMLMTKLKTCVAVVVAAVLVGVGGLAYRAAGQGAGGTPGAAPRGGARPLTDLEVLQREVAILKARTELLQEEVRRLKEAVGKGRGDGLPTGGAAAPEEGPRPPRFRGSAPPPQADDRPDLPKLPGGWRFGNRDLNEATPVGADPVRQAEEALRQLRAARDDAARRRAADALERALRRLRRPADVLPGGGRPGNFFEGSSAAPQAGPTGGGNSAPPTGPSEAGTRYPPR